METTTGRDREKKKKDIYEVYSWKRREKIEIKHYECFVAWQEKHLEVELAFHKLVG